jgi:pimeloyl-ACP methyl ester carboxylesterase
VAEEGDRLDFSGGACDVLTNRHEVPALTIIEPRTFVLVHGAWHGGWCWERVAAILREAGHAVFTPTLTGLAERAHLLSHDITLDTHVADVVEVFSRERLQNAVLCAHSYGGWPVSAALEQVESQVSALVFLDAHLPANGECGLDTTNHPDDIHAARKNGLPAIPPPAATDFVSAKQSAWVQSMMTPHPIGTYLTPIRLRGARERIEQKLYIRTTGYTSNRFNTCRDNARKTGWDIQEIPCTHDVMIDEPEQLADILLSSM